MSSIDSSASERRLRALPIFDDWNDMNIKEEHEAQDLDKKLKSDEEIERFTVDSSLDDLARASLFLNSQYSEQRGSVIHSLPCLLRSKDTDERRKIFAYLFPLIKKILPISEATILLMAANAFAEINESKLIEGDQLHELVLPMVLEMLDKEENGQFTQWLDPLFTMLPLLPHNSLSDILEIAFSKGDVVRSLSSRIIGCRIIGALALLTKDLLSEEKTFQKAMSLCQDTDSGVRAAMCSQLNSIARAVGISLTESHLMSELMELVNDEEIKVKIEALKSLISLVDFLPSSIKKEKIIPTIMDCCSDEKLDSQVRASISSSFGDFLFNVAADIDANQVNISLDFFSKLVSSKDIEMRKSSAINFPSFLRSIGKSKYSGHLHSMLNNLISDSEVSVRLEISKRIFEVASIIGKDRAAKYLLDPLLTILRDDDISIREAALKDLGKMLEFIHGQESLKTSTFEAILPEVCKFFSKKEKWRQHVIIFNAAKDFHKYFKHTHIYDIILPYVFENMHHGSHPASAEAFAHLMRYQPHAMRRIELSERLIREFADSRSYWDRVTFLDVANFLVNILSRKWFKCNVLEKCMDSATDAIVTVRLRFTRLLPYLRKTLCIKKDPEWVSLVNAAIQRLIADRSDLVKNCVSRIKEEVDNYSHDEQIYSLIIQEADKLDAEKENQEDLILRAEESEIEEARKRISVDCDHLIPRRAGARRISNGSLPPHLFRIRSTNQHKYQGDLKSIRSHKSTFDSKHSTDPRLKTPPNPKKIVSTSHSKPKYNIPSVPKSKFYSPSTGYRSQPITKSTGSKTSSNLVSSITSNFYNKKYLSYNQPSSANSYIFPTKNSSVPTNKKNISNKSSLPPKSKSLSTRKALLPPVPHIPHSSSSSQKKSSPIAMLVGLPRQ